MTVDTATGGTATGELDGRVAIVTGGASGLGEAIAHRLCAEGARVIVADVDGEGAWRVTAEIAAHGGEAEAAHVDVADEEQVRALVAEAEALGGLDVLVCSAAVETRAELADTSDDEWQRVLDVNLKGPFLTMKHAIPALAARGGGSIVLLGSTLGAIGSPQYAAYCAAKGALVNLAKQAAIEHAADAVRVNVVSPSATTAGLFLKMAEASGDAEGLARMVAGNVPMGRLGSPDEVCDAVVFLAGDRSTYTSGTVIPLDGALAARRA